MGSNKMKTVYVPLAFAYAFAAAGCRGGGMPPLHDGGVRPAPRASARRASEPDQHPRYSDVCPPLREVATGISVMSPAALDGRVEVAKDDSTDEDGYRIYVVALRSNDGDIEEVPGKEFFWEIADLGVASVRFIDPSGLHTFGTLRAHADRFDRADFGEPETTLRICTTNQCGEALDPLYCEPCSDTVCTDAIVIVGVVNLEGRWRIRSGEPPLPVHITVRQAGREILTVFDEYKAYLEGDRVSFFDTDRLFDGIVAPTRDEIEGTVMLLMPDGGSEPLGPWHAEKVPVR